MSTVKWKVMVHTKEHVHSHWFLTRQEASDFVLPFVNDLDCVFVQMIKVTFLSFDCSGDVNHTQHVS